MSKQKMVMVSGDELTEILQHQGDPSYPHIVADRPTRSWWADVDELRLWRKSKEGTGKALLEDYPSTSGVTNASR